MEDTETDTDSYSEETSSSSGENEIQPSSWTYICKSIIDLTNSGEYIEVETVCKSAEQAFYNEDPVSSLKLFSLGLKQHTDKREINSSRHSSRMCSNSIPLELDILNNVCLAINQCALYVAKDDTKNLNLTITKQSIKQAIESILNCYERLSAVTTQLLCSAASLFFR